MSRLVNPLDHPAPPWPVHCQRVAYVIGNDADEENLHRRCGSVRRRPVVGRIPGPDNLPLRRRGIAAPSEAEFDRVLFVPRSWVDPVDEDLGGEVYQVDLGNRTLKALQYDPGINMAPTAKERGEGIRVSTRQADHEKAVDGDLSTAWFPAQYLCANYDPNQVGSRRCPANSDYLAPPPPYFLGGGRRFIAGGYGLGGWTFGLGGLFLIDKVRIVSGLEDESGIMKNFKLLAASGRTADPRGSIQYFNEIVEIRGNQRKVLDIEFPPGQRFDFLSILHAEHNTPLGRSRGGGFRAGIRRKGVVRIRGHGVRPRHGMG